MDEGPSAVVTSYRREDARSGTEVFFFFFPHQEKQPQSSALAPEMISMSSVVMRAWRARL